MRPNSPYSGRLWSASCQCSRHPCLVGTTTEVTLTSVDAPASRDTEHFALFIPLHAPRPRAIGSTGPREHPAAPDRLLQLCTAQGASARVPDGSIFFPCQMSYGLAPYLLNKQYALSQGQSSTLFVSQQHDRAFHRAFVLPCFRFTPGQPNRVFSPDTSSRGLLRYLKEEMVTSRCPVMTMSLHVID